MLYVLLAAVALFSVVWFRHLWARPVIEWLWDVTEPILAPPRTRSLGSLQRYVLRRTRTKLPIGVRGRVEVPLRFRVRLHPADYERVQQVPSMFTDELGASLLETAAERDWVISGTPVFQMVSNEQATLGRPRVEVLRSEPTGTTRRETKRSIEGTRDVAGGRTVEIGLTVPRTNQRTGQLVNLDGGRPSIEITEGLTIGRSVSGTGHLNSPGVSASHTAVTFEEDRWVLTDLDSTNGTWVNGRRVMNVGLIEGDEIEFGIDGPRFVFTNLRPTDRVRS